jgi:hypothetical protein
MSLVFSSLWEGITTRFSFSWFFVQCSERVTLLYPILFDRMHYLVVIYAAALQQWAPSVALRLLNRHLLPILDSLDDVFNLERPLLPTTSTFGSSPLSFTSPQFTSFSLSSMTNDLLAEGDAFQFSHSLYVRKRLSTEELEFLAKAITSHLQTLGCTVILGRNEAEVNSVHLSSHFHFHSHPHFLP